MSEQSVALPAPEPAPAPDPTPAPDPSPSPAPPAVPLADPAPAVAVKPDHHAAIKEKSLSHNLATCLCPYCRQRRVKEGIPHPTENRKGRNAKPTTQPKPAPVTPAPTTTGIVGEDHNPTSCPCAICSQWRTDRATAAAKVRYEKAAEASFDWANTPLDSAEKHLGYLRKEIELGAGILKNRYSTATQQFVPCANCGKDIINGRWAQSKAIRDPESGLPKTIFLCSSSCVAAHGIQPGQHGPTTGEPTGLHPEQRRH